MLEQQDPIASIVPSILKLPSPFRSRRAPTPNLPMSSSHSVPAASRFWDRTARKYARSPIADPQGYERTIERVKGLLSPQHRVLELGCGTGSTALRLAGGTGSYLATDISREMVAVAREKLAETPIKQLRFGVAEAAQCLAAGAHYDAVLAFNVLHLLDDLDVVLGGIQRVLAPGGRLITKTPCLTELNPLITHVLVPVMQYFGRAPEVRSFGAEHIKAALLRNGFTVEAEERHGVKGKDFRAFFVARRAL